MDIKEFYSKNKYVIKELIAVIIFVIALIPVYFAYDYYSKYDKKISDDLANLGNQITSIENEITQTKSNIESKKLELEMVKTEKDNMAKNVDKYPTEDRQAAIDNTNLFLMYITENVDTLKREADEKSIIPGAVDQIPFILECKSTYNDMKILLSKISEKKFMYVKDINVKLDGNVLDYTLNLIVLSKKTVVENATIPPEVITPNEPATTEPQIVLRENPFGVPESNITNPTENTQEPTGNTSIPGGGNTQGTSSGDTIQNVERLYPLSVDAELVQDYMEQSNIMNNNLATLSHAVSLKATPGSKVMAVKAGKVIFAGKLGANGNSVMIEHSEGNISYYGNLGSISVIKGQKVKEGQTVGYTGGTGDLQVPHLKFGYSIDNQFVDPKKYLEVVPKSSVNATTTNTQSAENANTNSNSNSNTNILVNQ